MLVLDEPNLWLLHQNSFDTLDMTFRHTCIILMKTNNISQIEVDAINKMQIPFSRKGRRVLRGEGGTMY